MNSADGWSWFSRFDRVWILCFSYSYWGPRSVDFRGCLSIEVANSDTRPPFRTDIDRVYAVFLSRLLHMEFLRRFPES